MDYRHDEWGVDVTVSGSQKGLMLPPGLSFNAISAKAALAASNKSSRLPKSYWRLGGNAGRSIARDFFHTRFTTNMLFGLREALKILIEEEAVWTMSLSAMTGSLLKPRVERCAPGAWKCLLSVRTNSAAP